MLKTDANPEGTPIEVFDDIRNGTANNRSQFFHDLTIPFYGFNRPGVKIRDGLRKSFWLLGMQGGIKGEYDCIREFSEVDYTTTSRKSTSRRSSSTARTTRSCRSRPPPRRRRRS